jgi:deazaflavin-dependent oxidoreductase (nitroreductase family)
MRSRIADLPMPAAGAARDPAAAPAERSTGSADTSIPPLAPAPPPTESSRRQRQALMTLNRWVTVPVIRAGLGAWFGTPIGGYVLLLRVRGRRTRLIREVPLSYFITEGAPWVLAGWGEATQWYRNVLADPEVEVALPGRTLHCIAEEVRDPATRRRVLPALVRAVGLPGYMGGVDPRGPDEAILDAYAWVPLIRLRPVEGPVVAGPDDPGGAAWIWRQAIVLGLLAALIWLRLATLRWGWRWLRGRRA